MAKLRGQQFYEILKKGEEKNRGLAKLGVAEEAFEFAAGKEAGLGFKAEGGEVRISHRHR